MDSNTRKDPYRAALDEASRELHRILSEYEKLCVRRERVERLVRALDPETGSAAQVEWEPIEHMSNVDGLTVVTRLTVLQAGLGH